jgi:DNA-binding CsgD family transcriptional regulator
VGTVEPPWVGRDEERDAVERLVATAVSGTGGVLVIEGDAGLGKSRLLDVGTGVAEDLGVQVVAAGGDPFDEDRPFGIVHTLLGQLEADLPPGWTDDPGSAQYLVRERSVEAVEAAATHGLLVVVDDLQWADRASLAVLAALARRAERLPLALALACRPEPRSTDLNQLLVGLQDLATRVALAPLRADAVAELAAGVLGAAPGDDLQGHLRGAAGNPFLVVETLRALEQDDLLQRTGDAAHLAGNPTSATFRATIRERLAHLGDGPVQLLEVGSVLGRSFTLAEAAAVLGQAPGLLVGDARTAVRAGLLDRVGEDGLQFRHDLVREALYDEVPAPERDQLHRAAAEALSGVGADELRVGQHAALGAQPGDPESARWLLDAAAAAAAYDPAAALGLLDQAALAAQGHPDLQAAVAAARLTALAWSGRVADAEAQAAAALAGNLDAREEALLEHRLGEALLVRGDSPAAVPHLRRALDSGALEGADRLRAGSWLAAALMSSYDLPAALDAANRALDAIDGSDGDPEAEANALATRCRLRAWQLDLDDALDDADRALAIIRRGPALRRPPHLLCGYTLADADQLDKARAVLREGVEQSERHGQLSALPFLHSALVALELKAGRWDAAITEGHLLLALGEETGVRAGRLEALGNLAQIAHHRGEEEEEEALLRACDEEMRTPGHDAGGISITLWAKAFQAEAAGRPELGAQMLGDAFALAVGLDVRLAQLAYGPDLARMAVASGDRATARYVADTVAPLAGRAGVASALGGAKICQGLAEGSSDRLVEAAEAFGRAGRPFEAAQAWEAAGDVLAARGRAADASALLAKAADGYRGLGASRHLARVEAQSPVATTGERPATGWDSLTPAEAAVAALVGEGLTNAEIAERQGTSRRTVETHVSRLYRKLEVPNRVVLARVAHEQAPPG